MAKTIIETHPFGAFIPKNIQCLIVGSFPGKEQTQFDLDETHWFYGAPRNQLWKILEIVYNRELKNRKQKQQLFEEAGIGMTDVIKSCVRRDGTNLDENLEIKEYNKEVIEKILNKHQPKVLFTSRFVEKEFKKLFSDYTNTDILPSPSPRYFKLRIEDKAKIYKEKLPKI
ncbi:MAG TPA: uracil-DNA glycosylase family protein [Flavisolibacter sp.]|nr:uracil-DNA glycosylase family protein [Flavisolibacter sp.]